MPILDKTGHKVPYVNFKIHEDCKWVTKSSDDIFKNKRVVLFALPGAQLCICRPTEL